jgi:NADH-quinone oxidoreductase subunit F
VDLHLIPGAEPCTEEREAVDGVVGPPASGWEGGPRRPGSDGHFFTGGDAIRARRHLLLPALRALQSRAGWISPGALNYVCRRLAVAPAEAWGVVTFYSLLSTKPQPPTVVHVCDDIACRLSGARELCAELEKRLGPPGTVARDGRVTWRPSPCLGQCERAPAAFFQRAGAGARDEFLGYADGDAIFARFLQQEEDETVPARHRGSPSAPQTLDSRREGMRLLRRVGHVDPGSLDDYRSNGGYEALRRAFELGPQVLLRETLESRLQGRGGAAFHAGRKWEAVAKAPVRPHYLVCNADESEPGTFKDRVIMEEDPFAVVEAMTIVAFATGCERGWIYVRGEYPLAAARLEAAVAAARARGFLGSAILGSDFDFDVEVRQGAGAYICGEETALFNSIEGFRGEPRNKPPFPVEAGLFGKPTVINNVETLVNVMTIVLEGGAAVAAIGSEQSTGHKLFCLSGHVARPGVYEIPFGATLGELIDLAGGIRAGGKLQAVLLGGAAGFFIGPDQLDLPLTFEGARAIGASIGSGVVMVFDHRADLADTVRRIAAFFRDESCGQCVPCRVGTQRQEELVARLSANPSAHRAAKEIALLDDIAAAMRDASICGLGQTASGAIQSAIRNLGVFSA